MSLFSVNYQKSTLIYNGKCFRLSHADLNLLSKLVESKGEVVKKDELLKIGWPDRFVSDNSVPVSIAKLRKVIGKNAILTSNGGYIFDYSIYSKCDDEVKVDIETISDIIAERHQSAVVPSNGSLDSVGDESNVEIDGKDSIGDKKDFVSVGKGSVASEKRSVSGEKPFQATGYFSKKLNSIRLSNRFKFYSIFFLLSASCLYYMFSVFYPLYYLSSLANKDYVVITLEGANILLVGGDERFFDSQEPSDYKVDKMRVDQFLATALDNKQQRSYILNKRFGVYQLECITLEGKSLSFVSKSNADIIEKITSGRCYDFVF